MKISENELRTTLLAAAKNSDCDLLQNNDARIGMSESFTYSDLEDFLENYGHYFATEDDLIEYCIFMAFDIRPIGEK